MVSRMRPTIITDARYGTTLSADARERRYLWTMAFRVVAFLAGLFAPLPYNLLCFLAAALLPAIAVLLGNARDNHLEPTAPDAQQPPPQLALGAGDVVPGDVVPGEVVPGEVVQGEVVPGEVAQNGVVPGEAGPHPEAA
ncbi:DUF3099 domain-containing protein [Propioniciclava soli]|uniref:DUF3099 domain-containing protein n=1 Tax=Propioniciclava soli TaxID=2775081 RepID=A0ABZ3C468_9ACTN|nr:DUF3099 domain-containing protein [Propioniciclava soli]